MSNKLPTAEQLLNDYKFKAAEHIGNSDFDVMAAYAIEFAKMHVKAALHEAAVYGYMREDTFGPEDIENSYPLENIK